MPGSWGPYIEMGFMFQSRRGVPDFKNYYFHELRNNKIIILL